MRRFVRLALQEPESLATKAYHETSTGAYKRPKYFVEGPTLAY
jgi:hypothetical protein